MSALATVCANSYTYVAREMFVNCIQYEGLIYRHMSVNHNAVFTTCS